MKIGVDGGATKTECILIGDAGRVVARRVGPGCNPSAVGGPEARAILRRELREIKRAARGRDIEATLLCMAGAPEFWRKAAGGLRGFGTVMTAPDAQAVLELAAGQGADLVLHAGTGSFAAAKRGAERVFAGGAGWRFGDEGSGYDLGRRAVARALLELQGWAPRSGLSGLLRRMMGRDLGARQPKGHRPPACVPQGCSRWAAGSTNARAALTAADAKLILYSLPSPNPEIAGLAPQVLRLAARGDPGAVEAATEAIASLLDLAGAVRSKLFGRRPVTVGLSGPILNHPFARRLAARRFRCIAIKGKPIEGVRQMLAGQAGAGPDG